jgi:hypothetical protein
VILNDFPVLSSPRLPSTMAIYIVINASRRHVRTTIATDPYQWYAKYVRHTVELGHPPCHRGVTTLDVGIVGIAFVATQSMNIYGC